MHYGRLRKINYLSRTLFSEILFRNLGETSYLQLKGHFSPDMPISETIVKRVTQFDELTSVREIFV